MPRRLRTLVALALLAVTAAVAGCKGDAPGPAASAQRYTVRGEVVRLPTGAERELRLRHEAIPDFVDRTGAVVGMSAMVMPFPVEAAASLDGIAVGDKVRAQVVVDWSRNRFAIESLEKLPPGTALEFGPAKR